MIPGNNIATLFFYDCQCQDICFIHLKINIFKNFVLEFRKLNDNVKIHEIFIKLILLIIGIFIKLILLIIGQNRI
jgi:hypothetical protein